MNRQLYFLCFSFLFATACSATANAAIVFYDSRAAFNSDTENLLEANFDDFGNPGDVPAPLFTVTTPLTHGGITYANVPGNLIFSPAGLQKSIINEFGSPLIGTILSPDYTALAFDAGLFTPDVTTKFTLSVTTNLASMTLVDVDFSSAVQGYRFFGFITDNPNDFFTSFEFTRTTETEGGVGVTNTAVGTGAIAVPEPSSLLVLSLASSAFCARFLRRREAKRLAV
jgi:hypothetical protein